MTNSVEMLQVISGIFKVGAGAAPLSALLSPEQLVSTLEDLETCAIFVWKPYHEPIAQVKFRLENFFVTFCIIVCFEEV